MTDSTIPTTQPPGARRKITAALAMLVLPLALYAFMVAAHMGACAFAADCSGYMNCARLLAAGRVHAEQRIIPGVDTTKLKDDAFVPLGFRTVGGNQMAPVYSTGLPLAIVAVTWIAGWHAGPGVLMFASCFVGLLAMLLLAREWGLDWRWSWIGVALLALSPIYIYISTMLMSDVAALCCVTLAVLLAYKSRTRAAWALAAGCIIAAAVLVRVTNIIVILPVAVCLGISVRRWFLLGLGGLPGAVFLLLYNRATYNDPLQTGYGNFGFAFGAHYILPSLAMYAKWMPILLTPLVIFVVGLPWLIRRDPIRALTLIAWIGGFFGFFATYSCTSMDWVFMRFLLPAFPACIVGALWVLKTLLESAWAAEQKQRWAWLMQGAALRKLEIAAVIASIAWLAAGLYFYRHERGFFMHLPVPLLPLSFLIYYGIVKTRFGAQPAQRLPFLARSLGVLAACLFLLISNVALHTLINRDDCLIAPLSATWAEKNLPPNALIYSMEVSGSLYYYTHFAVLRSDSVTEKSELQEIERACAADSGRPIYAMLYPYELEKIRKKQGFENWTQVGNVQYITCWRLNSPPPSPVVP